MTYRPTEWPHMIHARPDEARARILDAYRATRGNAVHAARALGLHRTRMQHYVRRLDLTGAIEEIREAVRREAAAGEG